MKRSKEQSALMLSTDKQVQCTLCAEYYRTGKHFRQPNAKNQHNPQQYTAFG
jgi:hypothetical protein